MATRREQYEAELIASDKASTVIKSVDDKLANLTDKAEVELSADDKASGDIERVSDETRALDNQEADVELTAEDKATAHVNTLRDRLSSLTASEYEAVLTAEATKLQREVDNAAKLLARVDGDTATAVIDARNDAQLKLDAVETELNDIDSRTADATLEATDHATGDIRRVDNLVDEYDRTTADATLDVDDNASGPIGGLLGNLGQLGLGPGTVASLGVAGLTAIATSASDAAINVETVAGFTGASLEDASRLIAVWRDNGLEVGDLMDILAQFTGVLNQSPEIAEQLGINLDDGKDPLERLIQLVGVLNSDQLSANDRILLGSQLFGEEGVRQISALTTAVGGDLQGAIDAVAESRIVTEEDLASAHEFRTSMADVTASAQEIGSVILKVIAPAAKLVAGALETWPVEKILDVLTLAGEGIEKLLSLEFSTDEQNADVQSAIDAWNEYAAALGAGEEAGFSWLDVAQLMADKSLTAEEAIAELSGANTEAEEATVAHTEAIEDQTAALNDEVDALNESVEALDAKNEALLAASDAYYAERKAVRDAADAVEDYEAVAADSEATDRDREAALDDVAQAHGNVALAAVEQARQDRAANGVTLSRVEAIDIENRSLMTQAANLSGPLRQAVLEHVLRLNGIPEQRITEILTDADPNNLAQVSREIDTVSVSRTAAIQADMDDAAARRAEGELAWLARPRNVQLRPSGAAGSGGSMQMRARGDPFTTEGTFRVGEDGPEDIELPTGARINTAAETASRDREDDRRPPVVNNTVINMPQGVRPTAVVNGDRTYRRHQGNL